MATRATPTGFFAWLRRYRLPLGLALAVAAALLWLAARLLAPRLPVRIDVPILPTLEKHSGPVELVVNVSLDFPQDQLPVYVATGTNSTTELFTQVARALDLNRPLGENMRGNSIDTATLENNTTLGFVEYANFGTKLNDTSPRITYALAEDTARTFLRQLGYPDELLLNESQTLLLRSEETHYEQVTTADEAVAITFVFSRLVHGLPVRVSGSQLPDIVVMTTNSEVVKASLPPTTFAVQERQTLPLLSSDALQSAIAAGNFAITNQLLTKEILAQRPAVHKVILNEAHLEYRLDERQGILIPYVGASGQAILANGESVDMSLITPAIAIKERR